MATAIFIGDELTATGFRLTGVETMVVQPSAAAQALVQARARAVLVIITAELARHVPVADLEAATLAETPVVAVIPDVLFHALQPDVAGRLRRTLGIED